MLWTGTMGTKNDNVKTEKVCDYGSQLRAGFRVERKGILYPFLLFGR